MRNCETCNCEMVGINFASPHADCSRCRDKAWWATHSTPASRAAAAAQVRAATPDVVRMTNADGTVGWFSEDNAHDARRDGFR